MPTMKPVITVTRQLTLAAEQRLQALFEVRLNPTDHRLSPAQLQAALRDSDGLLCTVSDGIDRDVLRVAGRRATIIANFGVGYSNIDIDCATANGIVVTNTPDVLTEATADIVRLLILAATRRASVAERSLRAGGWRGFAIAQGLGSSIQGKVLGIVGMGRIGRAVARRAVHGFGMRVIYFNRSAIEEPDFDAVACSTLGQVLREADVLSLHVPGGADGPLVGAAELDQMKRQAYLVNTARGDVVDEGALIERLASGRLAGAGLDVYQHEPELPTQLLGLDNVTLLPHIGSATTEVRDAMAMLAIDNLVAHFGDQRYPSRVV